jgi:electron transfer flavoprotein beta subunit
MGRDPMRVAVFMKYVLDPEILSRDFSLSPATGLPMTTFPSFQFDQYDRIALEIALKFRDAKNDVKVLSVCAGPDAAQDRLRDTLALKVDEAVLIETAQSPNDYDRAAAFADWMGTKDARVILCGRMTSDTDSSEAGPLVAEMLGRPLFTNVVRIEEREGRVACKRETAEGYEWTYVEEPFVATATNAPDNALRKSKLQDVMRAQRLPLTRVSAEVTPRSEKGRGLKTVQAYIPNVTSVCEFIDGDNAQDKAAELGRRLRLLLKRETRALAEAVGPS